MERNFEILDGHSADDHHPPLAVESGHVGQSMTDVTASIPGDHVSVANHHASVTESDHEGHSLRADHSPAADVIAPTRRRKAKAGQATGDMQPAKTQPARINSTSHDKGDPQTWPARRAAQTILVSKTIQEASERQTILDGHSAADHHPRRAVESDHEGHPSHANLLVAADVIAPIPDDHGLNATQRSTIVESDHEGHLLPDTHKKGADVIAHIRQLWRQRQIWHQTEKSLTLRVSAICRAACDNDKKAGAKLAKLVEEGNSPDAMVAIACEPILMARRQIEPPRAMIEKQLTKLAKQLPVAPWALSIRGVGALSLAAIYGETGDIATYKSTSALWKRMGLAVVNGERQRRKTGAEGIEHGYSPRRRSVMFLIGGGLIGAMGHGPRPEVGEDVSLRDDLTEYQKLFVERLRYEATRDPEMRLEDVEKSGVFKESYKAHAANRARRYVEKRFLKHLYQHCKGLC